METKNKQLRELRVIGILSDKYSASNTNITKATSIVKEMCEYTPDN
jgi:hypothetical protein